MFIAHIDKFVTFCSSISNACVWTTRHRENSCMHTVNMQLLIGKHATVLPDSDFIKKCFCYQAHITGSK